MVLTVVIGVVVFGDCVGFHDDLIRSERLRHDAWGSYKRFPCWFYFKSWVVPHESSHARVPFALAAQ